MLDELAPPVLLEPVLLEPVLLEPAPADELIGATLDDRYLLLERIGEGGSARVYRARDLRLARPVAVKVHRAAADTPNERARREREVRLLTDARHSSIVEILDRGEISESSGPLPYLVLEYFDPADAAAGWFCSRDERTITEVGAQLADALAHLHSLGVVHRDVKPENVLVRSRRVPAGAALHEAKLSDLGIARSLDDARLTRSDVLVGTAAYLSPESLGVGPVGPASDVYALGLVLLEALTGRPAYTGTTLEISLQRMHHAPVLPAALPRRWRGLLGAMTALDPASRPAADVVASRLWEQLRRPAESTAPAARMRVLGAAVSVVALGALSALALVSPWV